MSTLNGDGPCADCGTTDNIIWFTDNVFWNAICVEESPILCIRCFAKRAEAVGYTPRSWRLLPEWDPTGTIPEGHIAKVIERQERWVRGEC